MSMEVVSNLKLVNKMIIPECAITFGQQVVTQHTEDLLNNTKKVYKMHIRSIINLTKSMKSLNQQINPINNDLNKINAPVIK